jgi:hypothetical protein
LGSGVLQKKEGEEKEGEKERKLEATSADESQFCLFSIENKNGME